MRLQAPAKINLSLKVLKRRSDGFHEIETLMAPISLTDFVTIERNDQTPGVELRCGDPSIPSGEENLAVRAAALFFAATKKTQGLRIELEKRIPHGAGLGGGSSDAATVLLGLNELEGKPLDQTALMSLAGQLGSDVPFFVAKSPSICRGRGEEVTPTRLAGKLPLMLFKPSFGVPTPWAYSRWSESRELPGIHYAPQKFSGVNFVNDLERPVFEKYVFLARLKMWLLEQPEVAVALLSGSGSTLFAVLKNNGGAEELAARAKSDLDPELWIYSCETL